MPHTKRFPIRAQERQQSGAITPLPETPAAPPKTSGRILLIDDDPGVRGALDRVLAEDGWNVITAAGGEEGLEYLQEREPDLLITDLRMGAVNGWDVLFHERIQRPRLPIFVITALPLQATGGADKFATEFFQKPLDFEALLAAIRRYLGDPPSTPTAGARQ